MYAYNALYLSYLFSGLELLLEVYGSPNGIQLKLKLNRRSWALKTSKLVFSYQVFFFIFSDKTAEIGDLVSNVNSSHHSANPLLGIYI